MGASIQSKKGLIQCSNSILPIARCNKNYQDRDLDDDSNDNKDDKGDIQVNNTSETDVAP